MQISGKYKNDYSLVRQNKMFVQFYAQIENFVPNPSMQARINYFAGKFEHIWKIVKSLGNK